MGQASGAVVTGRDGRLTIADPGLKAKVLALRNNPEIAATAAGVFTAHNRETMTATLGRPPSDGELYIAHFLGAAGAGELVKLASIKPQLTQAWTMRQLVQSLQAKADALAVRVRKGESLEAVGASAGVRLVHAPGVDRRSGEKNPLMSPEILAHAFGGKAGDVFVARGRNAIVVGKVDAIHPGDPATLARMTEQARPQMSETVFREIGDGAQAAARQKLKVKVDYERARAALGLTPLNAKTPEKAK